MVAREHKQRILEVMFRFDSLENLLHEAIHLALLRQHIRTQRACFVADVVQAKVVHDQRIPILAPKLGGDMARYVVVDFCEILEGGIEVQLYTLLTYRHLAASREMSRESKAGRDQD